MGSERSDPRAVIRGYSAPTKRTTDAAASVSACSVVMPLDLSGLNPWSAVSSQHHETAPAIVAADAVRPSTEASAGTSK